MRTTGGRGYQIDIRLAYYIAFLGPSDYPSGAFALGKAIGVCAGILLAFEERNQQIAATTLRKRLAQVTA